ncbi:NADPH-dependent oxidoreductase [bacterium]|nr:MAG: NADPH-dependent oxidoreductase [bacterium]
MPKLHTIIVSTRPGRQGDKVGAWFHGQAQTHGKFEAELVDLAQMALPLFDEPVHPRLRQYENEHTKRWSASVDAADAFVFVTPEYNYATPPSLLNAMDYLVHEWAYKPVAFVSYGGVSGGIRSVQMTKGIATTLKMMPIPEAVVLPFFNGFIKEDGKFEPGELHEKASVTMLDELFRWTEALRTLRGV